MSRVPPPVTVAALYVDEKRGPYVRMPGVETWGIERDARRYAGPHSVVAHPPCARWCQLASVNEKLYGHRIGDDDGCFSAALDAVRRWGGVLEHPAETLAWPAFGLPPPNRRGGWQRDIQGEWVCQVAQSAYGHPARKLTWLLLVGADPPRGTNWRRPAGTHQVSGVDTSSGKPVLHPSLKPFADYLVALARSCTAREAVA